MKNNHNEVISTNLKRFIAIDKDTYKILVSYYYSGEVSDKENLTEEAFKPVIERMLGDAVTVVANSIVDYKAIPGDYKTCIVQARKKILPTSTASFKKELQKNNLQAVAKNIFVDQNTNKIWQKVITKSGAIQLVQNIADDLEELMKQRLDVSEVRASANPLQALDSDKFDYAYFYNPANHRVESGVVERSGDNVSIVSRQQRKATEVNAQCLIAVATPYQIKEQFEKDLKGNTSKDAFQAYINFWFNSQEGSAATKVIERAIKQNVLKTTASTAEDIEDASEIVKDIQDKEMEKTEQAIEEKTLNGLDEVEIALSTKFEKEKMTSFSHIDKGDISGHFILKFTQPADVNDIIYVMNRAKEVFEVIPEISSTEDFISLDIKLNKDSE
jgi:hypothetical protein